MRTAIMTGRFSRPMDDFATFDDDRPVGELFEIRDYHYDGDLGPYRLWWEEGLPLLRAKGFDVVGLWYDSGIEPGIGGEDPMDLRLGSANVTWIIRWTGYDERVSTWDSLREDSDWLELADRHPGWANYLHMSVRFMEAPDQE